jgi:hypothetical protein
MRKLTVREEMDVSEEELRLNSAKLTQTFAKRDGNRHGTARKSVPRPRDRAPPVAQLNKSDAFVPIPS